VHEVGEAEADHASTWGKRRMRRIRDAGIICLDYQATSRARVEGSFDHLLELAVLQRLFLAGQELL